jgi:iron complex outermembrane recepter protein
MSLKAVLAGSASMLALVVAAGPAMAQSQPAQSGGIETVVVTGIRASNQRAIDIKHQSVTIVDAVSAEDIGKLPDKNVADALQRVPGVTTFSSSSGEGGFDENNRIAIRGTNPSLTQTMVDGHTVATGDWFILDQFQTVGRSVAFDLFPAEIVDSVKVYKSQQADMVEGGTAGSVDIITRKPLDFPALVTTEASAQGVYADLPGKIDPQVNALFAWHNDTNNFGLMVQGFYEERHLRRDGQEFLGYNQLDCTLKDPNDIKQGCASGGATNIINEDPAKLYHALYPTLIGSALFEQHRKRAGGDFNMQWRPSNSFDVDISGFYSHLNADNTNNNFMAWVQNEVGSDNAPTSFTVKNGTLVSAVFPKINAATGNVVDGVVEDSIYRPGAAASTWYLNADALWLPAQNWNVHFKVGYTEGEGLTPSQPTWESDGQTGVGFNFANSGPAAVAFPDINTADAAQMNNDWAWSDKFTAIDQEFYSQADATYDIGMGALDSIEVGGRYSQHIRNVVGFDEGTCAFACPATPSSAVWSGALYPNNFANTISGGNNILGNIWYPDWSKIQALVMPAVTPYSPLAFYWPGSFKTKETDTAAYAQANFKGSRWRGNLGFRFAQTEEDISSYVSDVNGTANNYGPYRLNEVKHTYDDPLPSANLTYDLTEDAQQQLQFAASRVISRPDYSALGGAVSLTDSILTGTGGNPDLKPIRAWTFSGAWNWYYGQASLLSVGVFYMDLTSYVNFGTHDAVYLNATLTGQTGQPVFSTYSITSPFNTSGTDEGIELSWQQPLWDGFGVMTNYTLADGEQADHGGPLLGDAKHTANATLYYEQGPFSTRLAYTWRSSVLVGLDRSTQEHQASIGNLDASASYDLNDHLAVTFDVLNLDDETLKYYANTPDQPRAFYANGRQFFLGVRAKY